MTTPNAQGMDLLPCPFCGGKAKQYYDTDTWKCWTSGCPGLEEMEYIERERWNRRAPAVVEVIRENSERMGRECLMQDVLFAWEDVSSLEISDRLHELNEKAIVAWDEWQNPASDLDDQASLAQKFKSALLEYRTEFLEMSKRVNPHAVVVPEDIKHMVESILERPDYYAMSAQVLAEWIKSLGGK